MSDWGNKTNWKLDPITKAQKRAIRNLCRGWGLKRRRVKNKGEACDEISRLIAEAGKIKRLSKQSIGLEFDELIPEIPF